MYAGADAHKFSLGDTGGVPKEEYADTFPDAYIMKVFKHQQASYRRYLDGLKVLQHSLFLIFSCSCSKGITPDVKYLNILPGH